MCIRHVCHVSHVNGGCHVLIMWIGATVAWQLMHGSLDGRAHRRGPNAAPRRSHVVVMPTHEVSDARHLKCVEGL